MNRAVVESLRPFLSVAARRSERELTELLYQRWFIDWQAPVHLEAQSSGDDRVVAELTRIAGQGAWWAPSWTVTSRVGLNAFVTDGAVQLFVEARSQLFPKNPRPGAAVSLAMPCARGCATPGFFLLVSRRGRATVVHDKLYLHLTPAGGCAVIKRLRRFDARFEVKVANSAAAYGRRDSGVVYLDPSDRDRLIKALLPLSVQRRLFNPSVPPMTRRLGRGISVAEPEPVNAENPTSFGEERCRLVAQALKRAKPKTLELELAATLGAAGVDPEAPWRRAGTGSSREG